jgi:DNA-binding transcriptional LysR family regulator
MQLRQLEYFLAIWESRSFSGAATRLYVTQPSLSQQIRILEKELGTELLERGRHGVTLTPAGRVFLPQAQRVVQAAQDAKDSVRQVIEGRKGDVHVLTVRSVASGVLPPSAARWHSLFPTTVLRLHDFSHRRDLEEAARSGQGDLAVGPRPPVWEGPAVSLGYEQMVVVGPDEYEIGAAAEPAELAAADWVLYEPEQGMSEVVDWVAAGLGFAPRAVARTGQVSAALQFAVEGIGMAVAPENAVPTEWSKHARRMGSGFFRELVAFSRKRPSQPAEEYRDMLTSAVLPLIARHELPPDAACC